MHDSGSGPTGAISAVAPHRGWIVAMDWQDAMFVHWPMDPEVLRERLPSALELDTFEGRAWIGIVAFVMKGVRARGLPVFPGWHRFGEINVRTYVRSSRGAGVWFFSLDAAHTMTVRLGKLLGLPYHRGEVDIVRNGAEVHYVSRTPREHGTCASFEARLDVDGEPQPGAPGSFDAWMAERYLFYSVNPLRRVTAGPVTHEPWKLQPATATIGENTLFSSLRLPGPGGEPHVRFSPGVATRAYAARFV